MAIQAPTIMPSIGPLSSATPQLPQGGGGWFSGIGDWLGAPLEGASDQSRGMNRLGLLGAALQDAGNGGRTNNAQELIGAAQREGLRNKRDQANRAIQQAYASGDMNAVRKALVDLAQSDPEAVGHITQALQFGTPKIQDIGGAGYSQDPFTGALTQAVPHAPKAPLINNGLQSFDNGKTWIAIPGYVEQQKAIAGARRGPPKPVAAGPLGNPASLFGPR
jgi:hypothetical protein